MNITEFSVGVRAGKRRVLIVYHHDELDAPVVGTRTLSANVEDTLPLIDEYDEATVSVLLDKLNYVVTTPMRRVVEFLED